MPENTSRERVEPLVRFLEVVRGGARVLLVLRAVLLWFGFALAALVGGGLLDFVLRAPAGVRLVGLLVACGVGGWGVVRFVWPAFLFRPGLAEVALRVESQPVGRGGEMRGLLASAIELAGRPMANAVGESMRGQAVEEAIGRWQGGRAWFVLRPRNAARAAVLFLGIFLCVGTIGVFEPELARTGIARMLMPLSGAEWPRRQVAEDVTLVEVQAIDEALAMRAAVVKTNRLPGRTPVKVWYRGVVKTEGRESAGVWRSALLTGQKQRDADWGGELYERLIDPAEAISEFGEVDDGWIEYRFGTADDETETRRVRVVRPPAIEGVRARIEPPAYAVGAAERTGLAYGEGIELGVGDDERALVPRVLVGSRVDLEIRLSKTVAVPADGGLAWSQSLESFGRDVSVVYEGDRIRVGAVVEQTMRVPVTVVDSFGVPNRDEAVYVLDVVRDDGPEPIVREPDHDEQLVSTALVEIMGDARDDFGLTALSLERMVARVPGESEGATPEGMGAWEVVERKVFAELSEGEVRGRVDLGSMGLRAGDQVWLSVVATDTYSAAGLGREPVRSAVRRLRVISTSELLEQIQAELGGLRQAAMRLDEQQAALAERVADGEASDELANAQRALTERIAAQASTVERLSARQVRNGLEDAALSGMLRDAASAIAEAATASSAAAEAVDEAVSAEGMERARAEEEAADDQQRVRDELASLIDQLDRGEDGWVVRRSIERLLEEQREVSQQTQAAGERMLGRNADQLTPEERTELDRIADRQREIARRAGEAIDGLGERGRQLREADPAQSAAMAEAERQGREQEVAQGLEEAADDVAANQTSSAQSGQQAAMAAMEQMLEELDNAERRRNAALLRQLASLTQSIEGLIGAQVVAIERLAIARDGGGSEGLGAEMIRLRGNTLAVSADANGPDLMVVRGLVERGAEAQGRAISALRAEPMDTVEAERREQESLLQLREALIEAEKRQAQAQQAEQEEQRRALRQAYREQLEQQVVLRDEAAMLVKEQLTRRERATARGIGQRQEMIRTTLGDVLKSTQGLEEATVFVFAHKRLDLLMARAADRLARGEVDVATMRDEDGAVGILRSLVEVLGDNGGPEKAFDEGADGEGQSGGGEAGGGEPSPLLPPIKELMLLRAMQAEVAVWTRSLHDEGASDQEAISELGALQRAIADEANGLIDRMNERGGGEPIDVPEPGSGPGWEG